MRQIGILKDDDEARLFSDYLTQLHIDNQLAVESDGTYEIWVISEDDVNKAREVLIKFKGDPENPLYKKASVNAAKIRKEKI